jgi:hypothetical protein
LSLGGGWRFAYPPYVLGFFEEQESLRALTRQSKGTLHGVTACALIFALGISMAQTNKSDFFEKLEALDE